jgi:hypothetical protein
VVTQAYSDPLRAGGLPNIEIFWSEDMDASDGEPFEPGYYWWACFPGCLPDGEPNGPFETEEEALEDAQS